MLRRQWSGRDDRRRVRSFVSSYLGDCIFHIGYFSRASSRRSKHTPILYNYIITTTTTICIHVAPLETINWVCQPRSTIHLGSLDSAAQRKISPEQWLRTSDNVCWYNWGGLFWGVQRSNFTWNKRGENYYLITLAAPQTQVNKSCQSISSLSLSLFLSLSPTMWGE